jgi:Gram-negative bacterial TonB protein C-terminal
MVLVAMPLVMTSPVIGAALAGARGAQMPRPCPPPTGEPYLVCQVDRAPRPDSGNAAPMYPVTMLEANVSATLRAEFVVDSSGRVAPGSVVVADSGSAMVAYAAFAAAAKDALRTWRFAPGVEGGRPVAVRWEQILVFSVPPDSEVPLIAPIVLARDTAPDGLARLTVGIPSRRPEAILLFANRELLHAQRQALALVAPAPIPDSAGKPRVTVCLTINRGGQDFAADSLTMAMLETPGRHVVIPRDCPPVYTMRMYDPTRAPPGYIDPYLTSVPSVFAWNANVVVMRVDVVQTSTKSYLCWAERAGSGWRPGCRRYRFTLG